MALRLVNSPHFLATNKVIPTTASGNVCPCVKFAGKHLLTGNRNGRKLSGSSFKGDFFAYPVDSRHVL